MFRALFELSGMWQAQDKDDPSLSSSMIHRTKPNFLGDHLIYYNISGWSSVGRKVAIKKSNKVDVDM